MNVDERILELRRHMEEKDIDIYVVPTSDFHQSEYVGEYFKARKFITGFTGSAGTAVITRREARLWTDGRYFIQAAGGTCRQPCGTDEDGTSGYADDRRIPGGSASRREERLDLTGGRYRWGKDADMKQSPEERRAECSSDMI